MAERDQLPVPDAAKKDAGSKEVLRVWIANKSQHVSIQADVWDDVGVWGILLADLARHVANAYHQQTGLDRAEAFLRIKALLDAELTSPTDEPSGQIIV
jgi:hypothetical protein